ncbi:MAG: hypothetical protein H0X25_07090 [Acidobacteriales bacterium]|nr:hypothetical protein [Terriglobales bacterium]
MQLVKELVLPAGRRPAIVYAPTRKQAEALAVSLSPLYPTVAYHAGLDGDRRRQVQQQDVTLTDVNGDGDFDIGRGFSPRPGATKPA